MERKRNYGLRRQCRGVMLRADFSQQEPQRMERVKAAAELAAQDELAEFPFINAVEKELVPWRKLLQAFAAGDGRSIGHGGRLTAMRAEPGLPARETGHAVRAEYPGSGFPCRQERLAAERTAPLFQLAEARQESKPVLSQGEKPVQKTSPAHRGRLPKTRAA
jgi:hypothetical protein